MGDLKGSIYSSISAFFLSFNAYQALKNSGENANFSKLSEEIGDIVDFFYNGSTILSYFPGLGRRQTQLGLVFSVQIKNEAL
jgi:hypothetical protein